MTLHQYIGQCRHVLRRYKRIFFVLALLATILGGYTVYMSHQQRAVDRKTYVTLLELIAHAESHGNYNAYFGNAANNKIQFTKMTIQEVLDWQAEFIRQGSPSSAVGRYQFINTTLARLVDERGIARERLFDEAVQDELAIALLERRGSVAYVNRQLSKQQFAANLAKEWASLPSVVGGAPSQSYYAGDGLNRALVSPVKVLRAVDQVRAEQ